MAGRELSKAATEFRRARDLLLERRSDYDAALRDFAWPRLEEFNWALEHFDAIGADPGSAQPSRRGGARASPGGSTSATDATGATQAVRAPALSVEGPARSTLGARDGTMGA